MEEKEVTNKKNITTDTTDNENIIEQLTTGSNYENSNEKYQDNLSSAITFLVCGIGGLIVVLLNDIGILKFFTYKGASGILTNIVLIGMFVAFIVIAAISFKAAKSAKSNISTEEKTNSEIQDWQNIQTIPHKFGKKGEYTHETYFCNCCRYRCCAGPEPCRLRFL